MLGIWGSVWRSEIIQHLISTCLQKEQQHKLGVHHEVDIAETGQPLAGQHFLLMAWLTVALEDGQKLKTREEKEGGGRWRDDTSDALQRKRTCNIRLWNEMRMHSSLMQRHQHPPNVFKYFVLKNTGKIVCIFVAYYKPLSMHYSAWPYSTATRPLWVFPQ